WGLAGLFLLPSTGLATLFARLTPAPLCQAHPMHFFASVRSNDQAGVSYAVQIRRPDHRSGGKHA
ncbi:hypothetical protein, partial [Cupriavidus basilensis]|uniref:hypothetical protein n=1 Tax=Cupriavidus basilensis TaxID=68895 RepID=UPI0023E841C0